MILDLWMAFLWWKSVQLQIYQCLHPHHGEAPAGRGSLGCHTWLLAWQKSGCFRWSQRTLLPCQASCSSICYFFVEGKPLGVTDPWLQGVHTLLSSGYQQAWVFQISVSLQALLSTSFLKDMITAIFVQMPENLAGAASVQTSVMK